MENLNQLLAVKKQKLGKLKELGVDPYPTRSTRTHKIKALTDNKDGYMQVGIEDTGKGIPKENIPQLFERFYRVKEALEMSMGSGLGLYVSKKIIDEHNGEIWVESAVGKGSTFFFKLPVIA